MFKNVQFYSFEGEVSFDPVGLELALLGRKSRKIGMMETACEGWESPNGSVELSSLVTGNRIVICMRRDDKVLPASVVREAVNERAKQIEEEAGRPVGRKEKGDIKDQVLQELLPQALVKTTRTLAYLSLDQNWMVIDASSASKAEELIELLRKTLGTLNVVVPATEASPESLMLQWLYDDSSIPENFTLSDSCELHINNESSGVIRCKGVDISRDEIKAHLNSGYRVTKLRMTWREQIEFTLHEDLSLHSLKFDAAVIDQAEGDDEQSRFDADMTIMTECLDTLINELMAVLV